MTDEPESEDAEYGLVMPFINVISRGGRYDDEAYCAGYEMGSLEARLKHEGCPVVTLTIRSENAEQADLIAMGQGYSAQVKPSEVDSWSYLTLTKVGEP